MSNEITRAETERDTISLRSIDELHLLIVKEWNGMDSLIENSRKKVQAIRIKIGHLLLEIQQRIEAGENGELCTFWEWYADIFTRSRSDAERMMTIARQDDPEAAYQQRLERQKGYIERHYKKKLAPSLKTEAPAAAPEMEVPAAEAQAPETGMDIDSKSIPPPPARYRSSKRYPDFPDDDAIIEEMAALFERLSWDGKATATKRLLKIYNELQRRQAATRSEWFR